MHGTVVLVVRAWDSGAVDGRMWGGRTWVVDR